MVLHKLTVLRRKNKVIESYFSNTLIFEFDTFQCAVIGVHYIS